MAEQHKKADGTQTVNGDIPVVAPNNIGKGIKWNETKVLPAFKADLLAVLKGEEVKDFAGETKGFLLPSA